MKKSVLLGMSALVMCAAFTGCSKSTEEVFEQNQATIAAEQKAEYIANFEAKYGKVDPNQSWDFTQSASTRALSSSDLAGIVSDELQDPSHFQQNVTKEKGELKTALASATAQPWNPFVSVCMYPVYCYNPALKNQDLNMVVKYSNGGQIDLFTCQMKNKSWWNNNGATGPSNRGKAVNTFALELDPDVKDVTWALSNSNGGTKEINHFKEVQLSERTYWCFDYDGSGNYENLVFVVSPNPAPISKRYLIEDLGAKDDFDFNDIVVDVIDNNGSQKAIVRAMGGTKDFTLKIGNTTWSKAGAGFNVETMYNTDNINTGEVLAEFSVTGWNPSTNNISATVKVGEKTNVSDGVIIEIPFPKTGEVPMIIAIKPLWFWQGERETLPTNWWE